MEGEIMRKSGINSTTPKDMLLGAGTVFKNFKYVYSKVDVATDADAPEGALKVVADTEVETENTIQISKLTAPVSFIALAADYTTPAVGDYVIGEWDDSEANVLGATSGGNKILIASELMDIEVDGASVKIKGMTQKIGEAASLETNLAQHTPESIKRAIVGKEVSSLIKGFKQIVTKSLIELSDYLDNIAYVGSMTDGTDVIIIMENVICTSAYELEGKNKETAVTTTKFEASADFESGIFDTLPVYVFYPEKVTA